MAKGGTFENPDAEYQVHPDYGGRMRTPFYELIPASSRNLEMTNIADPLRPDMTGKDVPFNWDYGIGGGGVGNITGDDWWQRRKKNYETMWQKGPNALVNGPQNAFSAGQLQNIHAQGLNALMAANRQAMQGAAASNTGRGIIGNNPGGLMNQQLAVTNAGALAGGDLDAQLKGLAQGVDLYEAKRQGAQDLGAILNSQFERNFNRQREEYKSIQDEKQHAYDQMIAAYNDYNDFMGRYAEQAAISSGAGKDDAKGDQMQAYFQNMLADKKRNYLIMMKRYQSYF